MYNIRKKLMIQSWENLVMDGQTDAQTDAQSDKSDFIGRCPSNVKRPTTTTSPELSLKALYTCFI